MDFLGRSGWTTRTKIRRHCPYTGKTFVVAMMYSPSIHLEPEDTQTYLN